MVSVCFVCLGNICRSPTAEGVMRRLVEAAGLSGRVMIDSAGTGAWHSGNQADPRARAEAESRGLTLTSVARRFEPADFDRFDYIIAMDRQNVSDLQRLAGTPVHFGKIHLAREFDPESPPRAEVPDPYYGGEDGFPRVFDICEAACRGLLTHLRETRAL